MSSEETWVHKNWRPVVGWHYVAVNTFDFIIAPVMTMILKTFFGAEIGDWIPLTLQSAGLYHLAMGAVLGVTSWGRTQEKKSENVTTTTIG